MFEQSTYSLTPISHTEVLYPKNETVEAADQGPPSPHSVHLIPCWYSIMEFIW